MLEAGNEADSAFVKFQRLGVLSQSWAGWGTIHEKPARALAGSCYAAIVTVTLNCIMAFTSKPFRIDHHVPLLSAIGFQMFGAALFWRWGPVVANPKAYYVLSSIVILASFGPGLRQLLGPLDLVPFRNRLAFTCVFALNAWHMLFGCQMGWWAPDHPSEPFR